MLSIEWTFPRRLAGQPGQHKGRVTCLELSAESPVIKPIFGLDQEKANKERERANHAPATFRVI